MLSSRVFILILGLLLGSNAYCGALYAVKQTDVDTILVRIDPQSLVLTEIGPLRTGLSNGGLAWDPVSETLYMLSGTNRAELFTVDLSSGEANSVAPIFRPRLTGIAYDCIRDLIYALDWDGGLTHIDPSNGTLVGGSGASDPEGDYGFNGLGFNQHQDILVGIRDNHPWDSTGETKGDLYSIEWHIGGGKKLLYDNPQPGFSANGLAYDPDNDLYWSVNQLGELYSFDPSDGYRHTLRGSNYGALLALAYVHDRPCTKPPGADAFADTVIESNVPHAEMGISVAGAGDVNGDGFDDVIVASRRLLEDPGLGAAFVYHGSIHGVDSIFDSQLALPPNGLEPRVAGAGDVNGDGYDDVMVSAPNANTEEGNSGAVFVFHGSPSGVDSAFATRLSGDRSGAEFGRSLAGAGDVNGDGFDDVIVGSRKIAENSAQGAAFVFYGSSAGIDPAHRTQLESFQDWAEMGYSVAGAGDVNQDGFDDVIVGAPVYDDEDGHKNGAAFVFHGSASGVSTEIASQLETVHSGINLATSVSGAGDIDADGYDDVIVGAPRYDDGVNRRGAAFIYRGSASGVIPNFTTVLESYQDNARFGESVAGAGDVNGDGFADVIVGARLYDLLKENEGAAFVYPGSASGVETVGSRLEINQGLGVLFGWSVAGAGDVNGDGESDVIVGATGFSNPEEDEGGAFVFHSGLLRGNTKIDVGHSGAWYNPDTSGQGQLIDIEPDNQFMFLAWFTYTDEQSQHPNEQHWFTAQGNYSENEAVLPVYETLGGKFDDPTEVDPPRMVGSIELTFEDCTTGQASYSIDSWDVTGSFPLSRVIPGSENVCLVSSGEPEAMINQNDAWDGAWYNADTSGQGFLIDSKSNAEGDDFIFVAWFTYGDTNASGQRWLTAQGPLADNQADIIIYEVSGGSFDDPTPVDPPEAIGAMNIEFTGCNSAQLSYDLTDEGLTGSMNIERVIPGTETLCESLGGLN